jgi:hypothetical protein
MEIVMYRMLALSAMSLVVCVALAGECSAKARMPLMGQGSTGSSGLLARLNRPLVPTLPGLPTASPLGLIAPRLSNAVSIFQLGGLKTQAGRLSALGVLSPRLSPVFGMVRMPPKTPQAFMKYGLTILSPRAAVLIGILQGARTTAAKYR